MSHLSLCHVRRLGHGTTQEDGGGGGGRDGRIEVERRVKEGGKERDRGGEEEDRKG